MKHSETQFSKLSWKKNQNKHFFFFFLPGLSFTDTGKSQDSRRRKRTIFYFTLPLHPLTNIHTFSCNFACEMSISYFWSYLLYLQDWYSMRFTTLSNFYLADWSCEGNTCLFTWWFDFRVLLQQFNTGKR